MSPQGPEVLRRLAALKVVCLFALHAPSRARLAELARGFSPEERHQFEARASEERDAYWKKVKDAGLWTELTPRERAFAGVSVATMTAQQQTDVAWRVEAVAVLLWALHARDELPAYDTPAPHEIVDTPVREGAELRPPAELQTARAVADLWSFRGRTRESAERGVPLSLTPQMRAAGIQTHDDLVRTAVNGAHAKGLVPPPIDGDFPVNGKPYRSLSPGELAAVRQITRERLHALDWLTGRAPGNRWDDTPSAT